MSDQTFHEIHRALLDHVVLVFPRQNITPQAHIAFGRRFGELDRHEAIARISPSRISGDTVGYESPDRRQTIGNTQHRQAVAHRPTFTQMVTSRFVGMTEEESRPILDYLFWLLLESCCSIKGLVHAGSHRIGQ